MLLCFKPAASPPRHQALWQIFVGFWLLGLINNSGDWLFQHATVAVHPHPAHCSTHLTPRVGLSTPTTPPPPPLSQPTSS